MSKTSDKLVNIVLEGFQNNRGRASLYCFDIAAINLIIFNVISRFHNKNPNSEILIIVDCYETRSKINNYLKNHDLTKEHGVIIKLLSIDYIKSYYRYNERLVITVGINDRFNELLNIIKLNNFFLHIMTTGVIEHETIANIRKYCPNIDTTAFVQAIKTDYLYSPVEEYRIGIELNEHDTIVYNRLTEYINTSVSVFGSLDIIEKCRVGDTKNNISASEFRENLAKENGWNESLDTNIMFQKQIDDIYNPNALSERAHTFYTISKQRRDLLTDNYAKLDAIKQIILDNRNKKILIVSSRGEFAAMITEYINKQFDTIICGDYHDCLDNKPAYDEYGEPIFIKSGVHKGEHKFVGAQAQSTANEAMFNHGIINVLSIKSASNVKLKIACDIVIFTSPQCSNIIDLKKRFNNIVITGVPHKTYIVYCKNTIDTNKLLEEKTNNIIKTIIDETENNISFDENSGNIIL